MNTHATNTRLLSFAFAAVLAAFAAPTVAQLPESVEVPPGHLPQADVDFILEANTSNITQIAMGHAAESKAANPGIHSLADRIVSSHVKADQALQLLAGQKHVDLPRSTDADDRAELADLHARRRGGDFDAQYVQNVIDDHDRMIAMYEAARSESVDPDIRRYADTMLPALYENRDQAVALVNKQTGNASR
jgi:putative membrane protein